MIPSKEVVRQAVEAAAARHGVGVRDVLGKDRRQKVVKARADAIRVVHEAGRGRYTLPGIGRAFGLCHTTVLYWLWPDEKRGQRKAEKNARHIARRTQ